MELAAGLILAMYFGAIVKSLVNDIIMPPVGMAMGGVDFAELKVVLQEAVAESAAGAGDADVFFAKQVFAGVLGRREWAWGNECETHIPLVG